MMSLGGIGPSKNAVPGVRFGYFPAVKKRQKKRIW